MNEEEKKAIEFINDLIAWNVGLYPDREECEKLERILNLIEKLQKENEELKNKLSLKQLDINVVYNDYLEKLNEYEENSISIQKVKDKIEKLNKIEQDLQNSISMEEREECSDANISWSLMDINIRREVLQELIEEREEK